MGAAMKPIPGFPNYCVSRDGRVWSKRRATTQGGWLTPILDNTGYLRVNLSNGPTVSIKHIHRLVLETYVGPKPEGMETRHLNGNRQDNRLMNLSYGSHGDNQRDAVKHGTQAGLHTKGEKHGQAKLNEQQVRVIFHAYHDGIHTQQKLADHFRVTRGCVKGITSKRNWGHLWDD
jgi:hypothetical protein